MYVVGLRKTDVTEGELALSGLLWHKVSPREKILSLAPTLLDAPYKFGASVSKDSPNSFDCSSLTAYLYAQAGIAIPRICDDQYNFGIEVEESKAKPGDLVFFRGNRTDISPDKVGHVGVYMGDGEVIHAGGVSIGYGRVVREKIVESKYYPTGFLGFKNFIQDEADRYVVEIPDDRPDLRSAQSLIEWVKHVGKEANKQA